MAAAWRPREPGDLILNDVFLRADKAENGVLSLDEFMDHFSDGILSADDIGALFQRIDTHATTDITIDELVAYFRRDGALFTPLFGGIEAITEAQSLALARMNAEYGTLSNFGQFRRRFFLREARHQLEALATTLTQSLEYMERTSQGLSRARDASGVAPGVRRDRSMSSILSAQSGGGGGGNADGDGLDGLGDGFEAKADGQNKGPITTKVIAALLVLVARLKKDGALEREQAGRYKDLVLAGTPPADLLHVFSMMIEEESGLPANVEIGSDYEESD